VRWRSLLTMLENAPPLPMLSPLNLRLLRRRDNEAPSPAVPPNGGGCAPQEAAKPDGESGIGAAVGETTRGTVSILMVAVRHGFALSPPDDRAGDRSSNLFAVPCNDGAVDSGSPGGSIAISGGGCRLLLDWGPVLGGLEEPGKDAP